MLKARWLITAISAAIFFGGNLSTSLQDPWFQNLERPSWLTFEFLIPFIWIVIWICVTLSAIRVWEQASRGFKFRPTRPWGLMALYAVLGLLTAGYSPAVVRLQSLPAGLIVGGLATLVVYLLAVLVRSRSRTAAWLLLPYLIWGPIGTYLTWVLLRLNS